MHLEAVRGKLDFSRPAGFFQLAVGFELRDAYLACGHEMRLLSMPERLEDEDAFELMRMYRTLFETERDE